tara:strand:+ start:787 stop:2424 length:1638 start_codon:yes stop_codon:yes gene_type:complete
MYDGIKNISIPQWVENETVEAGGLDLLGLRNVAQSIGDYCLNGITTISPQIRYLAIRSWIIQMYAECKLPDDYSTFLKFGSKLEAAVAIGILLNKPSITGVIGSTKALEIIAKDEKEIILEKLVKTQIAINNYTGPSNNLVISYARKSGITGLTNERGKPLANIIMTKVIDTNVVKKILSEKKIESFNRDDLIELGQILSIDEIPDDEKEILLDIVIPSELDPSGWDKDVRRIATYVHWLQLTNDKQAIPTLDEFFEEIIYPKDGFDETLSEIYDGWLCFLIRDSIAVAHETTLQFVKNELEIDPKQTFHRNNIIQRIVNDSSGMENELKTLKLIDDDERFEDLRFLDIFGQLEKRLTKQSKSESFQRWDDKKLNELNLIKALESNNPGTVSLVPIVWLLSYFRLNGEIDTDNNVIGMLSRGGWGRLGLKEVIFPTIKKWKAENPHYHQIVGDLIGRTVDQHVRISWSRMATDITKDVSILKVDGDSWQFRKDFYSGRTAARLNEAIGWLKQLKLIGENGITSEGKVTLNLGYQSLSNYSSTLQS